MEKEIDKVLIILYQCQSKIENSFQMLGVSVYNGYKDGSLESFNYSLRDCVANISNMGNLIYIGNEYGLNIRMRKVEDDIELFLSDEDSNNLKDGMSAFNLNTSRDSIAKDEDEVLRCLPSTDLIKTYVGAVKGLISNWCSKKCDSKFLENYKQFDEAIAKKFAENNGIKYIPLDKLLENIDPNEEERRNQEKLKAEEERRKEEEKRKEIEKYSQFPMKMEMLLNVSLVPGMESLNKINEFSGEEKIQIIRAYLAGCKICNVKYFGDELKYVDNNEIKISNSKVIVSVDGFDINYHDLDKLRDLDRQNAGLEKKLKELEDLEKKRLEEEKKRLEEEKKKLEEEKHKSEENKRTKEESVVNVDSEPEEVESLPMDIGISAEDIENELHKRESELNSILNSYPIVSQSYGNPDEWGKSYTEYRKTLAELDEENDYILVMCKSSYSSNPIIVGVLKRTQVEIPKLDDEDDDSDVNYEYKFEFYDEFELLSTGITTLGNLGIKPSLELLMVPSKFTLKYLASPLLEICAKPDDIPDSIPVIFLDESRNLITKEVVAEKLGYLDLFNENKSDFIGGDLEESEYEAICRYAESMCLATSLEERLNMRVFHFNDTILYMLNSDQQNNSIVESYTSEQSQEYFNFKEAVKRTDGKISPLSNNYILPQMLEEDKFFSVVKSYSETKFLSNTRESSFVKAQVPNLKTIFTGIALNYQYFNSSNYQENFKVEREFHKNKGKSKEEIKEIMEQHNLAVVGSVSNSKVDLQEWEIPFFNYLKNLIKAELICENNVNTEIELNELIKNSARAKNMERVIEEWCRAAYALNYLHTGYVADEEVILSLGYEKEGVNPSSYCDYKVIKVGSDRNVSLKTDWGDSAYETDTSKKINGFLALERYVNMHSNTFRWAETLIRLLRWGSRKQKFLKLYNNDVVFDFNQAQIVEEYEDVSAKSMTNRDLVLNQILVGRYRINSLDVKNLGQQYEKYMRGSVIGMRQQNFKSVYASLIISLGRNDENNWEQVFVDTLTFVKSLCEHNGKVEIKGVDGEWSMNQCEGISFDSSKGRISMDLQKCAIYDEQTKTVVPKVQVRNEQTLNGSDINEYERINKNALEVYVGATDNVILSDLPVDGDYILHKMQIRTLDKECYEDAKKVIDSNPNAEIENIQLPFEVFTKFCFAENFIARTERAIKEMSEKWAMPYVIADYMYNMCVGNYMDNRYEMPIPGNKRASNLEIYWNCVLYGYNLCFKELSMNEDKFCEQVILRDGVLTWIKSSNNIEGTKLFQDDAVSMKLKLMVESTIENGGQISPVVYFDANFSGIQESRFANKQLLCLRGKNDFYFVFVEGDYTNVVLHEKNGKVPTLSIKNDKERAFFKKLSGANKIGYSSPELKSTIEKLLD